MLREFVIACARATPVCAFAFTGNDLNKLCTKTDSNSRTACAAYIEGAADGVYNTIEAIGGTSRPQVGQYFCLPADVTDRRGAQVHRQQSRQGRLQRDHDGFAGPRQGISLQGRALIRALTMPPSRRCEPDAPAGRHRVCQALDIRKTGRTSSCSIAQ